MPDRNQVHRDYTRQLGDAAEHQMRLALRRALYPVARALTAASGEAFVSIDDLAAIPDRWAPEAEQLALLMGEVHVSAAGAVALSLTGEFTVPAVINQAAQEHLALARNRLVGIGGEAWTAARFELLEGFSAGDSIPQLRNRVRGALGVVEARANTIARTEVISASNAGALQSAAHFGAETKTWLATGDARTRPEHAAADGQRVPIDQDFVVGGESIGRPGEGSAENSINCRCTLTFGDAPLCTCLPAWAGEGCACSGGIPESTLVAADFQLEGEMPWHIVEGHADCPSSRPWAVVKDADGEVEGCHGSEEAAQEQMAALYANEPEADQLAQLVPEGAYWEGVLALEGVESGDGRLFSPGSLEWERLPLPLEWQKETSHGGINDVVVLVGNIIEIERVGAEIRGRGRIDPGNPDGAELIRRLDQPDTAQRWVSVNVDSVKDADIELVFPEGGDEEDEMLAWPELAVFHRGRIRGVAVVNTAAFIEAEIHLVEAEIENASLAEPLRAAAYTVIIPDLPPVEWFDEPADEPAIGALSVTEQGRIYGYLAPARVGHRAYRRNGQQVEVPMGRVDYSKFMNKPALVERDGTIEKIAAGNITMGCGHAPLNRANHQVSLDHYDNSCSVVARVRVGENRHGVWVAGALLPDVDAAQVARMFACALSGDWQDHESRPGWRELTGALLVPVEGFPRAQVASMRFVSGALVSSAVPVQRSVGAEHHRVNLDRAADFIATSIGRDHHSRVEALVASVHGQEG